MSLVTSTDTKNVVQLIDVVAKRGAFEGGELATVAALRGRFVQLTKELEGVEANLAAQPQPVNPNQEAV